MGRACWLLGYLLCFVTSVVESCDNINACGQLYYPYLFRAAPGRAQVGASRPIPAGLWGGEICLDDNGHSVDLDQYGFNSYDPDVPDADGIHVSFMSYDDVTSTLLTVSKSGEKEPALVKYNMASSYLCERGVRQVSSVVTGFMLSSEDQPYYMDSECGYYCGLGPVAMLGGRVFFILSGVVGQHHNALERVVSLRELTVGPRLNSSRFDVLQNSRLVHVIHQEVYQKPHPEVSGWAAGQLRVASVQGGLHFFLQVLDTSGNQPVMKLLHIVDYQHSTTQVLHSQPINPFYTAGSLDLDYLGAVDLRATYLCWTAATLILCSHFRLCSNGSVVIDEFRPVVVLKEGEAGHVCYTGMSASYYILVIFWEGIPSKAERYASVCGFCGF